MTTPLAESIAIELPPNTVREKTQAKYTFTVQEVADLGTRLSHSRRDYTRIEAELDSIKQDYKGKLATVELEQDALCRKLDDGFEMREAAALVSFNDPEPGKKTYRHERTGELIRTDFMSQADFQLPMFRDPNGKDSTEPEGPRMEVRRDIDPDGDVTLVVHHDGEGTREDLGCIEDVPNAGQTNIGAALDCAAVNTPLPKVVMPDFEKSDWTGGTLLSAFRKAAKLAGWPEAAFSAFRKGVYQMDLDAMKTAMRPHVICDTPSFEALMKDGMSDFSDGTSMRTIFRQILAHYPEKYPGGNHEQNFNRFEADVQAAIEEEIARNRTTEGAQ